MGGLLKYRCDRARQKPSGDILRPQILLLKQSLAQAFGRPSQTSSIDVKTEISRGLPETSQTLNIAVQTELSRSLRETLLDVTYCC